MTYDHSKIEKAAREKWRKLGLYSANLTDESRERYYLLVEFPYPSGDLHIGHWYAFAVTDIYARMLRARGKNVLFPIGFDAFGLPAENAAIKHNANPREWTYKNMARMREQLATMGASFDWSKEVVTCDPNFYQWTQWLFEKLFEHGLAERREAPVKWCPKDQTVLANEQVIDGCCERCGTAVEEKRLTQWFLKITDYAERLLAGLNTLPWREEIKEAQRAWIGKSEGAYLEFPIAGRDEKIKVFTTRPDTIFGATYVVLAPEHQLVSSLLSAVSNKKQIKEYVSATNKKTERERSENKEKTGVCLEGISAINPATKEKIPVYVADYVLGSYGAGAVMAVPAHDERDFEFAKKFNLPIRDVIMPRLPDPTNPHQPGKEVVPRRATIDVVFDPKTNRYLCLKWKKQPWTTFVTGGIEEGENIVASAKREIAEETGYTDVRFVRKLGGDAQAEFYAAHKGVNRIARNSMLLFELVDNARKPVAAKETEQHEVIWLTAEEFMTVRIQHSEIELIRNRIRTGIDVYTEQGILIDSGEFSGRNSEEAKWDIVEAVGGEKATQYRIRDWLVSRQRYWGCPIPIVYDPKGKPHAIPAEHLPWLLPTDVDFKPTGKAPLASSKELRKRVTKIFGEGWTPEYDTFDTFVDSSWYFLRYLDSKDKYNFSDAALMEKWLPINRYSGGSEHTTMHVLYSRFFTHALYDLALVPVEEPFAERFNRALIMGSDGRKMSKSKGNVVNPDEFVQKYGADAVRMYLAFIGPYNESGSYLWNLEGVAAMRKFLDRTVRLVGRAYDTTEIPGSIQKAIARANIKIAEDSDRFKFNTSIAALMILVNELETTEIVPKAVLPSFVIMLAPFAPHLAEYFWEKLGGEGSVHQQSWPVASLSAATENEIVVQVAGRKRGTIRLSSEASEAEALAAALKLPAVIAALGDKEPARVVYVPGKIVNLVV
ncbi:MAG: class I tRNA ligase family protein [Minisyncoccia bacterium]